MQEDKEGQGYALPLVCVTIATGTMGGIGIRRGKIRTGDQPGDAGSSAGDDSDRCRIGGCARDTPHPAN